MQTFLPFGDVRESMRVLDQARLGKQRVETLQVLRALLLPTYGWQKHPVTRMWRGYLPGLAAYGVASAAEWVDRGHLDTTAELMREFAPGLADLPQDELAARGLLPPWMGDEAVHRSHRSNLIRKDPAFYSALFPGTPDDLDYVWPIGEETEVPAPVGEEIVIVRASSPAELDSWRDAGIIAIGELSPRGRDTPAWRAQRASFIGDVVPGARVGVLLGNSPEVHRIEIEASSGPGPDALVTEEGVAFLTRPARWVGTWRRSDFVVSAVLQDPRVVFTAHLLVR